MFIIRICLAIFGLIHVFYILLSHALVNRTYNDQCNIIALHISRRCIDELLPGLISKTSIWQVMQYRLR